MLWALALLGVLPAAFLFGDDTADSDSEAEADDMSTAPVADNADDGSDGLSFLLDASNIALRDSPLNLSDEDDASGEDDVVLPNDPDVAAPLARRVRIRMRLRQSQIPIPPPLRGRMVPIRMMFSTPIWTMKTLRAIRVARR